MYFLVGLYLLEIQKSSNVTYISFSKLISIIDLFHLYSGIILLVLVVFLNVFKQNHIIRVLHKLQDLDKEIEKIGVNINYGQPTLIVLTYILLNFILYGILEIYNCSLYLNRSIMLTPHCWVLCYIPIIANLLFQSNYILYILLIRQRLSALNRKICNFCFGKKIKTTHIIQYRHIYVGICDAGSYINKSFALQVLMTTSAAFIGFTTHAYYSFGGIIKFFLSGKKTISTDLLTTTYWAVLKLFQLGTLLFICQLSKNEVNIIQ